MALGRLRVGGTARYQHATTRVVGVLSGNDGATRPTFTALT